jgi:uncharacterized protein (TIGR00297 family)
MLPFSFLFNLLISWGLYAKQKLTISGAIASFVLGFIVLGFGHPLFYGLMMSFLFSSLLISKVLVQLIPNIKSYAKEHESRSWVNVVSNGSLLGVSSIWYFLNPSLGILCFGIISMAVATADTWASEIGTLSYETPWTLIRRHQIQSGLSGGVTWLGLKASMGGSLFISLIALPVLISQSGWTVLTLIIFALISLAGFGGSIVDSILGELFQAKFKSTSHEIVEIMQHSNDVLVSGVTWMNNHMVNFLSNFITITIFTPLIYTVTR